MLLPPWKLKQQSPPKHWYPTTSLHTITMWKTMTWMVCRVWFVIQRFLKIARNGCVQYIYAEWCIELSWNIWIYSAPSLGHSKTYWKKEARCAHDKLLCSVLKLQLLPVWLNWVCAWQTVVNNNTQNSAFLMWISML